MPFFLYFVFFFAAAPCCHVDVAYFLMRLLLRLPLCCCYATRLMPLFHATLYAARDAAIVFIHAAVAFRHVSLMLRCLFAIDADRLPLFRCCHFRYADDKESAPRCAGSAGAALSAMARCCRKHTCMQRAH